MQKSDTDGSGVSAGPEGHPEERRANPGEYAEVRIRGPEDVVSEIRRVLKEAGMKELYAATPKPDFEIKGAVRVRLPVLPPDREEEVR